MRHSGLALGLICALSLAAAGCEENASTLLSSQPVVSSVPWQGPERATYRLLDGDDVEGTGILTIQQEDGTTTFTQLFESEEFRDEVEAVVDSLTLEPISIERVIEGPEGPRRWRVDYEEGTVVVIQTSEDDERRDELSVPTNSYDSWTDVFLWRTVSLKEGFEATYSDVLSATLAKPDIISQTVEVKSPETIQVPAGTFDTWRMEIRSSGGNQTIWYADTEARPMIRYDNGNLVFELTALQ